MGKSSHRSRNRKKSFKSDSDSDFDLSASSSSSQSQSEFDSDSSDYRRRHSSSQSRDRRGSKHKRRHRSSKSSVRRDEDGKREKQRKRRRKYSSDEDDNEPENIVKGLLDEFPNVGSELQQLLEMIDNGQGVDIKDISDKLLVRHLKVLFSSLKLKRTGSGIYMLPPHGHSTLKIVGPMLCSCLKSSDNDIFNSSAARENFSQSNPGHLMNDKDADDTTLPESLARPDSPTPRRRVIGPAMPSRELLAAAAELAEAETLLRDVDIEADDGLLIGLLPHQWLPK